MTVKKRNKKIWRMPWYMIVLDMMDEKIPQIMLSDRAEHEMYALGNIFRKAFLPLSAQKRGMIAKRIEVFFLDPRIPDSGDTRKANNYLKELYREIICSVL